MGTYVVTGAASGIGKAIKSGLESEGHRAIGVDRDESDIRADLADGEQLESVIGDIHGRAPDGLDGLVPCAGVGAQNADKALIPTVNFFATVALVEGLMPALEKRRGAVVLICSNSATLMTYDDGYVQALLDGEREKALGFAESLAGFQLYGGAKFALGNWMRRRSTAAASAGVRFNALAPGYTDTAMTDAGLEDPEIGPSMREFARSIPIGAVARPEDQANAALFLLSEKAAHIAGAVLFVDGGHDAMFRPDRF